MITVAPLNVDEVFTNGDMERTKSFGSTNGDGTLLEQQKLPRRSSLIKDNSKRVTERKKTVSFSSLPNEKAIVTGEFI